MIEYLTVEVIPEFPGVGQGLDDAVHEAGVPEVDQSCEARQTHLLLLLFLVALAAGGRGVCHGLHHACGFGLRGKQKGGRLSCYDNKDGPVESPVSPSY